MFFRTAMFVTALALPSALLAQSAEDAIEARHGYMDLLSVEMAKLSAMAKGEVDYDEAAAAASAANIVALTQYNPIPLYVEGSSSDDAADSAALPAIWENPDDFSAKFAAFKEAAVGAPEAVMGGQENLGPVMQKLGTACKACHDDYRKPR